MFDDTTEAAWLCTCCHPALTHMHATPGDEACSVPGCGCVEFIRHPTLTNFTGESFSGTWDSAEDPLPSTDDPLTLGGLPVRFDSVVCDPGEVWLTGPDGSAVRVWPVKDEPDA